MKMRVTLICFVKVLLNSLTSLKGVPGKVGGDFLCSGNKVKFTRENVRKVCNVKGKIFV